jgi:hypothetical protein
VGKPVTRPDADINPAEDVKRKDVQK